MLPRGLAVAHRVVPAAVDRLPSESKGARNGQSTGGRAEQAYKHRARDAGEAADLRFTKKLDGA